jgi:hypothetical protein
MSTAGARSGARTEGQPALAQDRGVAAGHRTGVRCEMVRSVVDQSDRPVRVRDGLRVPAAGSAQDYPQEMGIFVSDG